MTCGFTPEFRRRWPTKNLDAACIVDGKCLFCMKKVVLACGLQ